MHNTSSLEEVASENQGYALREALIDGKSVTSAPDQSRTTHLAAMPSLFLQSPGNQGAL